MREDAPIDQFVFGRSIDQLFLRPDAHTGRRAYHIELGILLSTSVAAVVDLARRVSAVAVPGQVLWQADDVSVFVDVSEPGRQSVDTGRRWPQAGHQTGTG